MSTPDSAEKCLRIVGSMKETMRPGHKRDWGSGPFVVRTLWETVKDKLGSRPQQRAETRELPLPKNSMTLSQYGTYDTAPCDSGLESFSDDRGYDTNQVTVPFFGTAEWGELCTPVSHRLWALVSRSWLPQPLMALSDPVYNSTSRSCRYLL